MVPIIEAIDLMEEREEREEKKETALNVDYAFSVSVSQSGNYCSDIC